MGNRGGGYSYADLGFDSHRRAPALDAARRREVLLKAARKREWAEFRKAVAKRKL